jgi:SAM-dependent methyltransferase
VNNIEKEQTESSFKQKWTNNQKLAFSETNKEGSNIQNWIVKRNGFSSLSQFGKWLTGRDRILDAGCGNGRITSLIQANTAYDQKIVGIDFSSIEVAINNLRQFQNIELFEKDLLEDLSDLGKFDLIYCQEVLHHTADPFKAFSNLCGRLNPDGEIAIYVYKKKAPMREYADDYIRELVSQMPYEEAAKEMSNFAELGRILSELNIKVKVPEIKVLEIEDGEYDIQRFFYHFFLKCFWNPELSKDENTAINYDWYHPTISTRHTPDEVKGWFSENSLELIHFHEDHYGITARGIVS